MLGPCAVQTLEMERGSIYQFCSRTKQLLEALIENGEDLRYAPEFAFTVSIAETPKFRNVNIIIVILAKAEIQSVEERTPNPWILAFAGVT
jgi:hypothetical protein